MEVNKPTRRSIKIDIWEESRLGILPQISEPIRRGAKINRFHRFDLRVHDLLKTGRLTNIVGTGRSVLEKFTW